MLVKMKADSRDERGFKIGRSVVWEPQQMFGAASYVLRT